MLTDNNAIFSKEKQNVNTLLLGISILLILFKTMPIFQGYFTAYAELAFVMVGCFLIFPIKTRTLAVLPISLLFFLFQSFCREDPAILNAYNIFHGGFMILLAIFLLESNEVNKEILVKLFWVLIISITITQISSIFVLEKYPLLARYNIMGESDIISYAYGSDVSPSRLNVGGYGLVYMAPIYSSCLFALMKKNMFPKILFIGHVIITFIFIFSTQFMIGLLIYAVIIISIFLTNAETKKIVITLIIMAIFYPVLKNLLTEIFAILADSLESDVLSGRFKEMVSLLRGDSIENTDINLRFEVYTKSIKVFFENFLLGGRLAGVKGGGHSAILDYMAYGGILGLIILIAFFRMLYKKITEQFRGMDFIKYINFSFTAFFAVSLFNPMFYLDVLSIFVFCLCGFSVIASKKQ